ncbi:hypothetical protein L873DRAFT_1695954 [Choiromyces venosus 120613-1]|uniref:Uncharacterized protein n=1 Tax=Choiromyces venosus 120613-1 TaxID=1336337 RepID=A0A3N4JQ99_9PEZI|nr:hypothetical protein L873DRAFT_1695954 [Choiromyces venosus 120613-1]
MPALGFLKKKKKEKDSFGTINANLCHHTDHFPSLIQAFDCVSFLSFNCPSNHPVCSLCSRRRIHGIGL